MRRILAQCHSSRCFYGESTSRIVVENVEVSGAGRVVGRDNKKKIQCCNQKETYFNFFHYSPLPVTFATC